MKKLGLKALALALIVTLFVTGVLPAYAEGLEEDRKKDFKGPILLPHQEMESNIVGEVIEKREVNKKVYRKEDGSYEVAVYPVPVHFKKDGKWEDIDNTLKKTKRGSEGIYKNQKNNYTLELAEDESSEELVKVSRGNYDVSWSYLKGNRFKSDKKKLPKTKYKDNKKVDENLVGNQKTQFLEELSSEVVYENIEPEIDLSYEAQPDKIKESIILNEIPENNEFKFNLKTNGLNAVLNKDKTISFFDKKNSKKEVMTVDSPYMTDSAEETAFSTDIEVKLEENKNGYLLTIIPDKKWLNDKSRILPIIIDPTINTTNVTSLIYDSTVRSAFPAENEYLSTFTRVGTGATNGTCRTYLKYTLPDLTAADMVIDAKMNLYLSSDSVTTERAIDLHKVTQDWDSSTITWNNKASYESKVTDYLNVSGNKNKKLSWDITSLVKDWYTTGNNYGVVLKNMDETPNNYLELYASETATSSYRPNLTINYVNYTGREDYWTYHSNEVGRAGTGYVNDYNGNVVFTHDDISMTGNRMPINIQHVYNSTEKAIDLGYGLGWRLNVSQTVKPVTIGTV